MLVYAVLGALGLLLLFASLILDDVMSSVDVGPDWLTGISVGGFLTILGGTGLYLSINGWGPAVAAAIAIGAALASAAVINVIALRLMKTHAPGALAPADLIGAEGTSVLGAAAGAMGEIMLTMQGAPMKVNGRCSEDLVAGDPVRVTAASSITSVTVEKTTA